ncbi:diguanylate cyclase [Sulfurimonas sp. MAG313]|nr:diguanylate cyclase [Sulfurimonas sp. MAG313]MDF1881032.1 diguanylate cyclase [Sulfurimonas sp. MAG313]
MNENVQNVQKEVYVSANMDLRKRVKDEIKHKSEALLKIVLTLSENKTIKENLITNNYKEINLHKLSLLLKKQSSYNSVWFQIIDKKGNSFYRSWTKKHGDSVLNARLAVVEMMRDPSIKSTIGVGKFDLSFKSMVPIYHEGKYIGLIEGIAKFNSISQSLKEEGVSSLFIVDKRYKKQIVKPYSKHFIGDYYVANTNAQAEFIDYINILGFEKILYADEDFYVDKKASKLLIRYIIKDMKGQNMAYLLLSESLDGINLQEVNEMQNYLLLFVVISSMALFALIVFNIIRKQKDILHYEAYHDSLTKLPNRLNFIKRLDEVIASHTESENSFALLFIDIDHFKEINDTYGHEVGDDVLIQSAHRILSVFRTDDCVARLGGDEFTVVLDKVSQLEDIRPILQDLIDLFDTPITTNNLKFIVDISVGVSIYPEDGDNARNIICSADKAMYESKKNTHSSFTFASH